jgi:hypothetical protein
MTQEQLIEFYEAYQFIENHPALLGNIFNGIRGLEVLVYKCCKNGVTQHSPIYLYRKDNEFLKFLGKGHDEDIHPENPEFDEITVRYEDFYGYKWKFDHIEFQVEGGAHYYDTQSDIKWHWNRFADRKVCVRSARTYEEAIILFAKNVKEVYGDYSYSEFDDNTIIPDWIVENNKKFPVFDIDLDNFASFFKDGKFNRNPNNIHLKWEEVNALWWHFVGNSLDFKLKNILNIEKYLSKENYESYQAVG